MTTFCWKDLLGWKSRLLEACEDVLPPILFEVASAFNPDHFYSDQTAWLDEIRLEAGLDPEPHVDAVIANRLDTIFHAVQGFHAGRPLSIQPYQEAGLRGRSPKELNQIAHSIFRSLGVGLKEIEEISEQKCLGTEDGKVHVTLDDRGYFHGCGHYLIYGSEYLLAVAAGFPAHLVGPARQLLKRRGIPTVFEFAVPLQLIDRHTLEELSRDMLVEVFTSHCLEFNVAREIDFTITLDCPIPGEKFVDHYHPTQIPDPMERQSVFIPEFTSCSLCSRD